jgi:hypothetical protein
MFWMFYAFFWVISPASEFYKPTFRNTLFHLHRRICTYPPKDGTECFKTSAYKIQTPGNYPEESIKCCNFFIKHFTVSMCGLLSRMQLVEVNLVSHLLWSFVKARFFLVWSFWKFDGGQILWLLGFGTLQSGRWLILQVLIFFTETLVYHYQTTRCHNPQD